MLTSAQSCHCVTCRKLSGGPYQSFADVSSNGVTFYDKKDKLRYEGLPKDSIGGFTFINFSKVGERAFCIECYSPLAMRYRHQPDLLGLTLGTVDEETIKDERVKEALAPAAHIFICQKVWWYDASKDGIPTHDRFGGTAYENFETGMKAWEGKEG